MTDPVMQFRHQLRHTVDRFADRPQREFFALTFMRMVIRHPEWAQAAIQIMVDSDDHLGIAANDALLDAIVQRCPIEQPVEASS